MKFYESKAFRAVDAEWKKKLEETGFDDIEAKKKPLRLRTNTLAFKNRNKILEFILQLDHLTLCYPEMPTLERQIIERYTGGMFIVNIAAEVNLSERHVRRIITKYKALLAAFDRMNESA